MSKGSPENNVNLPPRERRTEEEDKRQCMRKLALWHTKTFKPIMTHGELERIMSLRGFVGQAPKTAENGVVWREYVYAAKASWQFCSYYGSNICGGSSSENSAEEGNGEGVDEDDLKKQSNLEMGGLLPPLPRPRLPYPRVDGLHIYTYRAFMDALEFCLGTFDVSELFHIRGMPLHRTYDGNKKFRRMCEHESIFVYRDGTLEPLTLKLYRDDDYTDDDNNNLRPDSCGGEKNIYVDSNAIRSKGNDTVVGNHVPLEDIITCKDRI